MSIFFVPYVVFAPPVAILGKKFGAARVLPILMFTFGSMTLLSAAATNFGGLFALRFFLGVAESGFFPLVIYYLTTFYRRGELARRLAIFYAFSNIANAFSGLLSFGVFQIKSSLLVWRYLFIIEGACSVLFSFFAYWYLPRSAAQAKFLNIEEKALAFHRVQVDSSSVVQEDFRFKEAVKIFKHPTTYAFLMIEICLGVPIQSVGLFMPQIIQRLGYDTVKTNLYTGKRFGSLAIYCFVLQQMMRKGCGGRPQENRYPQNGVPNNGLEELETPQEIQTDGKTWQLHPISAEQ